MTHFLTAAGPLAWPILALAGATLWFAAGYARSRETHRAWTAASLGIASLLMATLAAITGFQRSVGAAGGAEPETQWLITRGLAESLNGLVLTLFACVAAAVLVAYGAHRDRAQAARG